jgi:dsRNA-specific ribonuclease
VDVECDVRLYRHRVSVRLVAGDMTEWRALIVSNEMLGMVTARNNFSSHLRHSSQQLQRDIDRYLDLFSGLSSTDSSSSSHLFSLELKALADIFEALIGAILKSAERVSLPCCSGRSSFLST